MRDYDEEIMGYEDDAEDRYDDYNDEYYDEDDFDAGFDGNEDSYDDDYEEEYEYVEAYDDDVYDNYQATSIGKIDPNDRTLTFVVENTSGADAEAILFGGNEDAAQVAGVSVSVEESSHKEVREESKSNPFKIAGMKMSVSDPLQFDNVMKVTRRTATGSQTVRVYQPRNATSPQNFTQGLIDDANFEMDVTGQDSLRFIIKNGVTAVLTLTIKARANMGNLLKGQNVAELSSSPRTTGLPQIDLLRMKKPSAFGLKPATKKVKKVIRKRPATPARRRSSNSRRPRRFLRRRR